MKSIWLVPLSGALVTATMALAVDDASAAYRSGAHRSGVYGSRATARGVYRPGVARAGIYRGGVYGTRYGYRPGWRAAAAGVAVGAAAASTAAYYGDGATYGYGDQTYDNRYRGTAYADQYRDRPYYNVAGRTYEGGTFAGGVYRPAGVVGYDSTFAARSYSSSDYPTRAIVSRSNVPAFSYYGPLCHPRVDKGCQ